MKRLRSEEAVVCTVEVFPLEVREQLPKWPEQGQRETRWFRPQEAAAVVLEEGLGDLIRQLEGKISAWTGARPRR